MVLQGAGMQRTPRRQAHGLIVIPFAFHLLYPPPASSSSQATGSCLSLSDLDREMALWIWYYALYNQLAGGIIGATLASQVAHCWASITVHATV